MINTNNKGMFINSNKGDYSSKKVNIDIKNANGGYGIAASAKACLLIPIKGIIAAKKSTLI